MLKLIAVTHNVKPGPPLSPILGQQQIKVNDFIAQFTAVTTVYLLELPLLCQIHKLSSTKFTLTVKPPTYSLLVRSFGVSLTPVQAYGVLKVRRPAVTPFEAKTLFGVLTSNHLPLSFSSRF